ncbi:winged helix-turn-helix transcriptional regulator [Agromyces laixinhei]|uniref:winged helix-turn-helix transcriptional regulator n=1 Tax=Agromyces laixinhei TaxID=2585717 RepID=UPI0012EEC80E|nr:helix-turn-helix domain-containing protein [Agromyces laixinhei]
MVENVNLISRRSYGQFCGLARALDIVGDRWNLLIVRELLPGPLRYGELKASLPGVASNLLAERLRTMEETGVVERALGGAGVLYGLTRWGAELKEPMEALGRWGVPLLATGRGDDEFRPRWLTLALPAILNGRTAAPPLEVGFEVEGLLIVLRIDEDGPSARIGDDHLPETIFVAEVDTVVGLVAGTLTVDQALNAGELHGDADALRRAFVGDAASQPLDPRGP